VDTWALFTHPEDDGRDGALAVAAAVAWLAAAEGPEAATPEQLLERLAEVGPLVDILPPSWRRS
jgi:ADP-ribosylglycohydrolase